MADSTTNRQEDELEQAWQSGDLASVEQALSQQGYKPFRVNRDGKPTVMTVGSFVGALEPRIANAPLSSLEKYRQEVKAARRVYTHKYGGAEPRELARVRKRIAREIAKREKTNGTTPAPYKVTRNSFFTKEYLLDRLSSGENISQFETGEEITADDIAERYRNALTSRPAGFIVDAIQSYVRDYFEKGESEVMHLNESGGEYEIRDTFNNFCERADIRGDDRKAVKATLFAERGERPLERVVFVWGDGKGKESIEIRFISARVVHKKGRKNQFEDEGAVVDEFILQVNAPLYEFLKHRGAISAGRGKGKVKENFQNIPLALNAKIDRNTALMKEVLGATNPQWRADGRSTEGFREATLYLMNQWDTGKERRKRDMKVTWEQLMALGYLPARNDYARYSRRHGDLSALYHLLRHLHQDGEAFSGCGGIELVERPLSLVFRVKAGK